MSNIVIRYAVPEDASDILAIYEPYILNTAITFETEKISVETYRLRMQTIQQQYPWLVCELEGKIVGYAYCSKFKEKAAYDWDCECSIYIREDAHRQGIATTLYTKLFDVMKKLGYYNIYAFITYPHDSSIALHKKFGFAEIGLFKQTGFKMGKWWDVIVMVKQLASMESSPVKPKTVHELSDIE